MKRAPCTPAWHLLLRSNRDSFRRETHPIGHLDDGAGGLLELGNCRSCGSTLALEVAS